MKPWLAWNTGAGDGDSPVWLAVRLLIPGTIAFAFFLSSFLILPPLLSWTLGGLMILFYIPPAGKESIIPLGIVLGIPWWLMVAALTLLDVLTSLFMILNFALVLRIPRLGPWVSRFLESGDEFMKERPWIARWRIPGVAFFVFLPFQGTGGVGATVVGLITGLSPLEMLLAIGIGSLAESLLFALGSEIIYRLLVSHAYVWAAAVIAVIVIAAGYYLYRKRRGKSGQV